MASDDPAGMDRSKPRNTSTSDPGYAKVRVRVRIWLAGSADIVDSPTTRSAALAGGPSAPALAIAGSSVATALTGADAPSNAQFKPPNAMLEVPIAACANATAAPSEICAPASDRPSAENTA